MIAHKRERLFENVMVIGLICVFLCLFMPLDVKATNDNIIRVFLDNKEIHFSESDGTPFLDVTGRSQAPLRKTMESAGVHVSYDNAERSVSLSKDGINIKLFIDSHMIHVGESIFRLDTVPVIIQSRTYVPLRFIFEQFGYAVEWHGAERSANIAHIADGILKWSEPQSSYSQGYQTPLGFSALLPLPPEMSLYEFSGVLPNGSMGFANNSDSRLEIANTISIMYEIHKINPNGADDLMSRFVFDSFAGEIPEYSATWIRIPYSGWEVTKGLYRIKVTASAPIVYYVDGEMKSNTLEEIAWYGNVEILFTVI